MKLSLGIVLMAAPVFIIALGALFLQSRYLIHKESMEHANSLLNTTIHHVRNYLGTIETSTNASTKLLEENFTPDSILSVSNRLIKLNPLVSSCSVSAEPNTFPQYGRFFSVYSVNEDDSITTVVEPDFDYFDKVWYKAPIDSGKACWVDPFHGHTEGLIDHNEAIATYCKPIRQKDGKIVGALSVDLSFKRIEEAFKEAKKDYPNAHFVLLGGDGRYFIHPDSTVLFRKTIFADADPVKQADLMALGHEMISGKQGNVHVTINGELCHVCYRPVPGTSWSLALICDDNSIMQSYHKLTYIIIGLIIIGLLIILWISFRIVKKNISPINQLVSQSQQIADGNYEEEIPTTENEDAIGQLQNSFATMQEALKKHISSINETTKETNERNKELQKTLKQADESVKQKFMFIQNVSQQVRTPMNIIQGFADVLRESVKSKDAKMLKDEDLSNITNTMKHNVNILSRMVLMLYESSDTGASDKSLYKREDEVACNEIAQESINYVLAHFPGEMIQFKTDLPDTLCILTNRLYLMRTLCELLYNAAKYSDGQHIGISISQTENTVRFVIEDKGPGLPAESQALIYMPFTKVNASSEGLGLGLPLCKRYTVSLGGDLIFDTTYQEGCRIIVEMPK